jgi:hypothetical protein
MKCLPSPEEHQEVQNEAKDDGEVDGQVVSKACSREHVVEVDRVRQYKYTHGKAENYFVLNVYITWQR